MFEMVMNLILPVFGGRGGYEARLDSVRACLTSTKIQDATSGEKGLR